jgi:hypothetical protein
MSKIKLNLNSLSVPEKIARAQQIVAAMSGNEHFTSPQPTLARLTSAIEDVRAAHMDLQTLRQEAKTKTGVLNQQEATLDGLLGQLANYVESISGSDEAKITSAGMDVRAAKTATGDLHAPQNLSASAGDRDGEIDLSWDKVNKARSYVVERSPDPPTNTSWQHAGVAPRSQTTIEGLTSGTKYWFRVAAVGPNGQSPWSNLAAKIAP